MSSQDDDLETKLHNFAPIATKNQPSCVLEIQTRTQLIDPYLRLLGYYVHDQSHCKIEYTPPIGKSNERVDYALLLDDQPFILIEAKAASYDPLPPDLTDQLQHYFVTLKIPAHFAALTNGVTWHWYRPMPQSHTLEDSPFLSHDIRHPDPLELPWLNSLLRHRYNHTSASVQAIYIHLIRRFTNWFHVAHTEAPDDLIKFALSNIAPEFSPDPDLIRPAFLTASQRFLAPVGNPPPCLPFPPLPVPSDSPPPKHLDSTQSQSSASTATPTLLPLPNGDTISSFNRARAWRPPNASWQVTDNALTLYLEVIRHLSSLDKRGRIAFFSSSTWSSGEPVFPTSSKIRPITQETRRRYTRFDPENDLWTYTSLSNPRKCEYLEHICSQVQTHDSRPVRCSFILSSDGEDINPGPDIQIWLPEGRTRTH